MGLVWLLLLVATGPSLAAPARLPALTGRVVDEANILPADDKARLTAKLAALETQSSDQLIVVTLESLGGRDIAEVGYDLGKSWAIGQKGVDNGLLLIVAPNERRVRIEVGRGLEGTVTDLVSGYIIRHSILPAFKAGDYAGGVERGVDDLTSVLLGDAEEWQARASRRPERSGETTAAGSLILLLVLAFMALAFLRAAAGRRAGGTLLDAGGRHRGSDVVPMILWGLSALNSARGSGRGGFGGGGGGGFGGGGGGGFGGGGASGGW